MSNASPQRFGTSLQSHCISFNYLSWLVLLAWVLSLLPAHADEQEDEYLRIYDLVQSADTLNNGGKFRPALAKYREAEGALLAFKRNHPEWNPASVSYRLNYLAVKIAEVSDKISNSPATAPGKGSPQGQPERQSTNGTSIQEVKLVEAGAEPRKVLRLHPKPGYKQVLELSMKPTMEAKIGEMTNPPMKMPGMKVVLELTVKDVSSEGDISYQTVFSEAAMAEAPGADPQMAVAVKSAMGSLKGLSGAALFRTEVSTRAPSSKDLPMPTRWCAKPLNR